MELIGIPDVLLETIDPCFLNWSTFSKMMFLISKRSTTTSIIQSQFSIFSKSSSKFPVVILLNLFFAYNGEGFDLTAAVSALFTILLRSFLF